MTSTKKTIIIVVSAADLKKAEAGFLRSTYGVRAAVAQNLVDGVYDTACNEVIAKMAPEHRKSFIQSVLVAVRRITKDAKSVTFTDGKLMLSVPKTRAAKTVTKAKGGKAATAEKVKTADPGAVSDTLVLDLLDTYCRKALVNAKQSEAREFTDKVHAILKKYGMI